MRSKPDYQKEPCDESRATILSQGYLTPLQLFRIAAWKSARGLAPLTLNGEREITGKTETALRALAPMSPVDVLHDQVDWNLWEACARHAIGSKDNGTGLLGLKGVGYPMATAIISCLLPTSFPVIDRWTIKGVYGDIRTAKCFHANVYAHFTRRLVDVASNFPECRTIHRVDQAVMNRAINCAHATTDCGCIPFDPVGLPAA